MFQSRTHTCNELRLANAGETVTLVGWYENMRKVQQKSGFSDSERFLRNDTGRY